MGDRNFDPEATREVAQNAVPTIATAYAELSEKVVDAGENMENGGVSEEMNAYFTDYHLLLRNATTETSFERYHDFAFYTPERFSDAEIDYSTELGADSAWQASRITAQETPTVKSEQRVMATAVLLGDFYVLEILVRFEPGTVQRADCGPIAGEDCVMTATSMAEFLATSGHLEELHAGLETAVDGTA
ncbi:hypothetical protein [Glycomyces harbinensis]|uniref:Uncharacterized protein n=1 Tax=Glycomyces harbinensis TaxID=58114 RepID=A0A1G6Z6N4_9ACTN|nr:hypothetical protein [Glycomyces harbinensis]SDD97486.1 hypothetical protein SAMN05216270_11048 [Glycomyces harbinensis]